MSKQVTKELTAETLVEEGDIDISIEELEKLKNEEGNGLLIIDVREGVELIRDGQLRAGKAELKHVPMRFIFACESKEGLKETMHLKQSLCSFTNIAFLCKVGMRSHYCALHCSRLIDDQNIRVLNIAGGILRYQQIFPDAVV